MTNPTKTAQAVALVERGLTVYAAAKQVGVDHGSVYRAIAKAKQRGTCPHCGQMLPPGFPDLPRPMSKGAGAEQITPTAPPVDTPDETL